MLNMHLGMPKTGTSVLQRCLSRKADELGIAYPPAWRNGSYGHHALAVALKAQGHRSPVVRDFLKFLRAHSERQVIVSSESFTTLLGPAKYSEVAGLWRMTSKILPTRLVIVLRRMDQFTESMYLQSTRFGTYSRSIADFVRSRGRWRKNFLAGLGSLKKDVGDGLLILPYADKFDVLESFEYLAGLAAGDLSSERVKLPSTAKLSAKAQAVLLELDQISEEISGTIDRRSFVNAVSRGMLSFSNDMSRYTVLSQLEAQAIRADALEAAEINGVTEYVEAFGDVKETTIPHVILHRSLLSNEDIDAVRGFIARKP